MSKERKRQTEDIRQFMAALHLRLKNGQVPTDREMKSLSHMFYERDKDPKKIHDLEMSHVIRGFEWGMIAMRQIIEGNNLPIEK
jgi:hypothetical protein